MDPQERVGVAKVELEGVGVAKVVPLEVAGVAKVDPVRALREQESLPSRAEVVALPREEHRHQAQHRKKSSQTSNQSNNKESSNSSTRKRVRIRTIWICNENKKKRNEASSTSKISRSIQEVKHGRRTACG